MEEVSNFMKALQDWTHSTELSIIYDTDCDEFTVRMMNSKIMNKKFFLVVIDENNNVYGSYHSKTPQRGEILTHNDDPEHFIFAVKENTLHQFKPSDTNDNILKIFPDYDIRNIINVGGAFGITSDSLLSARVTNIFVPNGSTV